MTAQEKKKLKTILLNILIVVISTCFVVGLWYLSWIYIDKNIEEGQRGAFGDKFGAINALFSGLAFAGIIFTILLQSKELKLQREELKETRSVFESQNKMISQQKFENTYFQMLTLLNSIINSIDLRNGTVTGRDCFRNFYKTLVQFYNSESLRDKDDTERYLTSYTKLYNSYRSDLSHYFRTLYHIFKFIDSSDIKDKRKYSSIVRAQLSSFEQILLFYNCLHENGRKKFKPLIEKYVVFKNIDEGFLFNKEHLSLYEGSAYKNPEDIIEENTTKE